MVEDFLAAIEDMNLNEHASNDVVYGDLVPEGFIYERTIEKDEFRWYMITWSIFEKDGRYVAVQWERGLTEIQENYVTFNKSTVFEVQPYDQIIVNFKKVPEEDTA